MYSDSKARMFRRDYSEQINQSLKVKVLIKKYIKQNR